MMTRAAWVRSVVMLGAMVVASVALRSAAVAQEKTDDAGSASDAAAKAETLHCPVTGEPVQREFVTRFRGKWVYFASAAARDKFTSDPYTYADAVREQWAANPPLRVQVRCPVTGDPPAANIYIGTGDDAVFFATEAARTKWEKDPRAYAERLAERCYTFQTGCGLCGRDIKPAASRTLGEMTVYFCCDGCADMFLKGGDVATVKEQIVENRARWQKLHPPTASQPTTQPAGDD
jgi:YHS domain-containing protein